MRYGGRSGVARGVVDDGTSAGFKHGLDKNAMRDASSQVSSMVHPHSPLPAFFFPNPVHISCFRIGLEVLSPTLLSVSDGCYGSGK